MTMHGTFYCHLLIATNMLSLRMKRSTISPYSAARRLYPAIREYFESEEGQCEFEEWKKQKKHEKE